MRRKTSHSRGESQQQTQPTYWHHFALIQTRATLVGGECPEAHYCATVALLLTNIIEKENNLQLFLEPEWALSQ